MLESQQNIDQEIEEGTLGKNLERLVNHSKKYVGRNFSDMNFSRHADEQSEKSARDRDLSANSGRSFHDTGIRISSGTFECCVDLGRALFVQPWRQRPRDADTTHRCLGRNFATVILIVLSGIITWESSVAELQLRIDRTIIFPLYLPHSISLAAACVWTNAVAPGNLVGLYSVRIYMVWRGNLGFTVTNTLVMLLVAFLATIQSHIGAFFLRKLLCGGGTKKIPTIDSVKEAVWYLVIVFLLSLIFNLVIAVCTAISPLIQWSSFWRYWATWWLGILATMITVTPLCTHLLAWEYRTHLKNPCKLLECALVIMVTSAVMVIVFFLNLEDFRPLPYLCFPLITWMAFRFNTVGWAVTVSIIAYCGALGTIRKRGAIYNLTARMPVSSPQVILQIELFSCVMGVVGIILAAAVREKKHLTQKLHQLNVELEHTVDTRTMELRKTNEELQISQQKAEQASHAKSDFLANMSHEIRTPIHGILGLTALLMESELTTDQKESLESVKECADLLLHIINSVLDLAKIEAGRLEVEKVSFNIRKMVSSTLRMLQARAQQRGLQLLWEVDKAVPQMLVGDVGKLQQCLINLVGNALKFTHKGSVTVSVKVAAEGTVMPLVTDVGDSGLGNRVTSSSGDLSLENPQCFLVSNLLEFEVRDTGIGISQEKLQDMFKPFTQADASTSRLYGGTGLGLCIVHRFVELLGGTIWAESEMGKGSAFHFRLPLFLHVPQESPSESPKFNAEKFQSRQSWSLMGGLIFNPPGKYQGQEDQRISLGKTLSDPANRRNPYKWDPVSSDRRASSEVTRLGNLGSRIGSSNISTQSSLDHQLNLVQPQNFVSASSEASSTLSDWEAGSSTLNFLKPDECPMDSATSQGDQAPLGAVLERERGNVVGSASLRSGLSRESSVELGKILDSKVSLSILLAEDNAINQKVASRQLEKHGHVVTIVGDGQQAVDVICSRHDEFDLVLMDVQMPVMDGLTATQTLRKAERQNNWMRLPVLGLTAHAIQGYQDTCLKHGMDGYLGKPFDIHQLLKTIGHLLPSDKLE
ncbi:uncharacterized protein [Physcomitrium patens]|uniref:histidine kinase n=1 Tax=Physcomitrium patens TaxID=3218 RepID=A9SZZ8_PHYPA|nr:hybrid signal transduction histidine kinase K-like [Physcomitrium patens]PNR37151.1 hypothetical protein PHYPA_020258 [Physcomitrium patens]|eukprot:XP_024399159.1 hybrid signal transduction histidine kinase K-like [Physcomitrella patens]